MRFNDFQVVIHKQCRLFHYTVLLGTWSSSAECSNNTRILTHQAALDSQPTPQGYPSLKLGLKRQAARPAGPHDKELGTYLRACARARV